MDVNKKGPYLAAALICEKVLEEKDEVKSAIRIFDRLMIEVPEDPACSFDAFQYELYLLFIFKMEETAEKIYHLKVSLIDPHGEMKSTFDLEVPFEGGDKRGIDVVISTSFRFDQGGTYWFSVYLNDEWLTKIPLRIELYQRSAQEIN
ncbi:MAG: hypothetical protein QHH02_00480 [Syntrophomonadaceae bacterium]|nr:hypothetical protein [Syntrophomonadaceae bacterium]